MRKMVGVVAGGLLATAVSDLWQRGFARWIDGSRPDWRGVGRWVLGFRQGRLIDPALKTRPPEPQENAVGWSFHYIVGAAYALFYRAALRRVGLRPSLAAGAGFGLVTLVAPLFMMKPAMGGGFLGWRAARPWVSFFKTLSAHLSFGIGLGLICRR